jgi:hypothetical protein
MWLRLLTGIRDGVSLQPKMLVAVDPGRPTGTLMCGFAK